MYEPLIRIIKDEWRVTEVKVPMEFLDKGEDGKPEFVSYRLKQTREIIEPLIKK